MTAGQKVRVFRQGVGAVIADDLNSMEQTCDTFAELRATAGVEGLQVVARGAVTVGDGQGGTFYWNTTSTAPDDGENVLQAAGSLAPGRWIRLGSGGVTPNPTTSFDTLALFRSTSIEPSVNTVSINGYRTVNDGGRMTLGRTTNPGPGIWASADGSNWRIVDHEPNVVQFGAYTDSHSHPITGGDISANPQWIGVYSVGTEWFSVAAQELIYTCLAANSTVGSVVWNAVSGLPNRPFNLLPGHTFVSNQTILMVGAGIYFHGDDRLTSVLSYTGPASTPALYLNSAAYATIERGQILDTVSSNQLVVLDHAGSPGGLSTQQISFRDFNFAGTSSTVLSNVLVAINPVSGGSGQGDTILFSNCLFIGSRLANIQLNGQNTLSIIFEGGDQQQALTDSIALLGASAYVYGTSFQNSTDFFHQGPSLNQFVMGGADFHAYSGAGATVINAFRDVRSETNIPILALATNAVADSVGVSGNTGGWGSGAHFPLGYVIHAGSKAHLFMLVDDGGPQWFLGDVSGSTSLAVNLAASWTVNQWAGYNVWERFTNGSAVTSAVVSNTATAATLNPAFGATTAGRQIKIAGSAGGIAPSWDSGPTTFSVTPNSSGQGFTTTAGSNVVTVGSQIYNNINVNDYVVIFGAWSLSQGGLNLGFTSALIGQVQAKGAGPPLTLTLIAGGQAMNATVSVHDALGYYGTGITDGNLTWLDIDSDAIMGLIHGRAISVTTGRARLCQRLDAMSMGRLDWYRGDLASPSGRSGFNSTSAQISAEEQATFSQGAGTLDLTNRIANGPLLNVSITASCTFSWPTALVGVQSFEINAVTGIIGGDVTITMSGAWKGPATVDLGSTSNKLTHISAQWDNILGAWVFRGSTGPY